MTTEKTYLSYEERMKEGERIKLEHRTALEEEYGTSGHPKADTLYRLAWEHGHAHGLHEVDHFYSDFVELLDLDKKVSEVS